MCLLYLLCILMCLLAKARCAKPEGSNFKDAPCREYHGEGGACSVQPNKETNNQSKMIKKRTSIHSTPAYGMLLSVAWILTTAPVPSKPSTRGSRLIASMLMDRLSEPDTLSHCWKTSPQAPSPVCACVATVPAASTSLSRSSPSTMSSGSSR